MQDDMGEDRSEPSGVGSTGPALTITRTTEVRAMADASHYTPQGAILNPEHSENWQSIGQLARLLAEKAGGDA